MTITLITPIRDAEQKISGWTEREIDLNAGNIESVGYVDEIGKCQLLMTSGKCVPVKESREEIRRLYQEAYT